MNLKNALRLTFLNNNMVIKSLIYRLFIFSIYSILSYLLLKDLLVSFNNFALSKEYVVNTLNTIKSYFGNHTSKLFIFISLSFFTGLLNNIADSSIVDIINNHMSILSREGFFGSFVRNFKLALSYAILYSFYNLIFLSVSIVLSFIIILGLMDAIGWFTIPLSIIVFVILISLKQTIISQTLPSAIVNKTNIFVAIKKNTFKKTFFSLYSNYILAYSLVIYLNISAGLVTFGAALMLSVPLSFILLDIMGLTSYYEINKMKYYITYDEKCIPKELRENEEVLLNEMNF